jgi:hypothetical protein
MDLKQKIFDNKYKLIIVGSLFAAFVSGFSLAALRNSFSNSFAGANSTTNNTAIKPYDQYNQDTQKQNQDGTLPVVSDNVSTSNKATGASKQTSSDTCPVKGKKSKTGKNIYYLPGSLFFSRLKSPTCFATEQQAIAAGFVKTTR